MRNDNRPLLQIIESTILSLIGTVEDYRLAHYKLSTSFENQVKTLGLVDSEILTEINNILFYGITSVYDTPDDELEILLKHDEIKSNDIVRVLFENNIQNQRLTYNPSNLVLANNHETKSIALSGGNLTALLSLLSVFPSLVKPTIKLVYENIEKNTSRSESLLNILVLLNEIAEKVISKPEKMITSILDTIFDRHCEFLGDVLTKQVVHVHYSGPVLMIDLLGDYRVVILDKFIKGLHLFNSTESFDYNDSVKQMISKTITNINVEMLENYIKQSFHFLNKK